MIAVRTPLTRADIPDAAAASAPASSAGSR